MKLPNKYESFKKIRLCIESSINIEQLKVCDEMIFNFNKLFNDYGVSQALFNYNRSRKEYLYINES